jgi:hypothetical protein
MIEVEITLTLRELLRLGKGKSLTELIKKLGDKVKVKEIKKSVHQGK